MDRHKCTCAGCNETFTGEKPEGWMTLQPMRGSGVLYYCPTHGKQLEQEAYRRFLMEAEAEGNA